ncbi:Isochorismatase hydrolase [Cylindrobasidium torrendii FP15055 ss-10]|uniref:Isochorismatase hydrolase n=1 Tax=Cylindrobasidium torrendii FP15055 ss-10 TaxID=1314674 RepID=A0A0D7BNK8_9AGAR|nr:Isochorismatase hydrolase [Cylindrobasidium torrendii FP15055 ss-10]
MSLLRPDSTLFLLCDVQAKFRPAIHNYDGVVANANKLMKIAKLANCGVLATTQHSRGLGPVDPSIDLSALGDLHLGTLDKTLFSMLTPEVKEILVRRAPSAVVLMGIEAHICVQQTALQLLTTPTFANIKVYIAHDAVSSSHPTEMDIAIHRLRAAGAVITTSESLGFELIGDAIHPNFREFSKLIKETKMAPK